MKEKTTGSRTVLMLVCKNTVDKSIKLTRIDHALELDNRLYQKYDFTASMSKIQFDKPADRYVERPVRPENHEMIPDAKMFGKCQ